MQCRICGNSNAIETYTAREMMFGSREAFSYFLCSGCGCLQIADFPPDMSKYYPEDYDSLTASPVRKYRRPATRLVKRLRVSWALRGGGLIAKLLFLGSENYALRSLAAVGLGKGSRILDVGCGSGSLLYALKNVGFENLLGVDPYIGADITYPNGLSVLKKSVGDVDGQWDLIMFHHSFEHLPDPLATLQTSRTLLADGGLCLIRIPTVSSHAWRTYKTDWVQLDPPRHFFLHSLDSMRLLADKAGFVVTRVEHDSTAFQFWGSEQYAKDIPLNAETSFANNPAKSIFSPAEIASFGRMARELNARNDGDQVAFYLEACGRRPPPAGPLRSFDAPPTRR